MLGQFEFNKLKGGTINRAIKNLDKEVDKFLKIYDENKDKEIDINELTEKRDKLVEDIIKGKGGEAKSKA